MSATPPIDLETAYERFYQRIGADRNDEHLLHASDLGGCLYATHTRLAGKPQMPFDNDSRDSFLMGFAVEDYVGSALDTFTAQGYVVTKGREVNFCGIIGHLDYDISDKDGKCVAVIDVRTTKNKVLEVKHDHALKSAFYAEALGGEVFCEWMFSLGFGKVTGQKQFWLKTRDYRAEMLETIPKLLAIRDGEVPAMEPPRGETWRCTKGYCNAPCQLNARYDHVTEDLPA